jgi:hypothetical protein
MFPMPIVAKRPPAVFMNLRIPATQKAWLERESGRSFSSMNAEIIKSIQQRIDRERERETESA